MNQTAEFNVTATGQDLSYQWKKDGKPIGGAVNSTHIIAAASLQDAGTYTVDVSDICGTITSRAATLTVGGVRSVAALQAVNGQYVCAEGGGGREVVANRNWIREWETFRLIDLGNGSVALQAAGGQFVCAEGGGGREVAANRNAIGPWETFRIINLGNGSVALQAAAGQYVCAEGGGGRKVAANRNAIGSWETFRIIPVAGAASSPAAEPSVLFIQTSGNSESSRSRSALTTDPNGDRMACSVYLREEAA